jgi:hypothetical protein
MERQIVDDHAWAHLVRLLPCGRAGRGRPRGDDRAVLEGVLYVIRTGIAWKALPPELGYGSGITCWRRWRDWRASGIWEDILRHVGPLLDDSDDHRRDANGRRAVDVGIKAGAERNRPEAEAR